MEDSIKRIWTFGHKSDGKQGERDSERKTDRQRKREREQREQRERGV